MPGYICICGNIGAGKSTLIETLKKVSGLTPFLEKPVSNAYFQDFYKDPHTWWMPCQLTFFVEYMNNAKVAFSSSGLGVVERTLYENVEIFVRNLERQGIGGKKQHSLYRDLYTNVVGLVAEPDLIFFLDADIEVLVERIRKRSRQGEDIDLDYLYGLQNLYRKWASDNSMGKIITVDANRDIETIKFDLLSHLSK